MNRRNFIAAAAASTLPLGAANPRILLPSDTPDELGFRLMWYNPVAPIDQGTWKLRVGGLVEKPEEFSLSDLRRLPHADQSSRLKCVQCWSARTTWGGFRFENLLELVKPKATARAVRFDCADKWYEYLTIAEMLSPRVLMALDMAGRPLEDRHGAPLRLIDPGRYGYKSAKLITAIHFVAEGKGSMACDIGPYYSPTGEIKSGYDHPLDFGPNVRRQIGGGEITEH